MLRKTVQIIVLLGACALGLGFFFLQQWRATRPGATQTGSTTNQITQPDVATPAMQQARPTAVGVVAQSIQRSDAFAKFDLGKSLSSSLRDAQLGAPEAQYRAAVLLRECRDARMTAADLERLAAAGVTGEHINLIKQRVRRCEAANHLVSGDISVASKRWFEAALRHNYPLSLASELATSNRPARPEEIDAALRTALSVASDDLVLRSDAFFLVLAAMDKRSAANGMEVDATVRNAWTLLHCRETWECDLEGTVMYLQNELKPVDMQLAIALTRDIDKALEDGKVESVRLY